MGEPKFPGTPAQEYNPSIGGSKGSGGPTSLDIKVRQLKKKKVSVILSGRRKQILMHPRLTLFNANVDLFHVLGGRSLSLSHPGRGLGKTKPKHHI